MTLPSRPNRGDHEQERRTFREQAAASDVTVLHCRIPTSLHRRLRHWTVDEETSVTGEVVKALEMYLDSVGR